MQSPVKKEYITQTFGANPDAYAKFGLKGHNGIDYRAFNPDGTRCYEGGKSEVFAPHGGKVLENFLDKNGYGWYVKIEDVTQGSTLAHFSSQSPLEIGTTVQQGQFVGYQGTTGNSTGIHLHWGWYPIPRNRQNGYNGYVDQAGKYQPYTEGENMNELHTYLGVTTDAEAKSKLNEHLGEVNGKCNWGMTGDKGGYLGSERKKNNELSAINTQLVTENASHITEIEAQKAKITQLEQDLADCEAETPDDDLTGWVKNGLQKEVTTGDTKWTTNYKPA